MKTPLVIAAMAASAIAAAMIAFLMTPLVGTWAKRAGAKARPGPRKIHTEPIPQWGGLGIFFAFLIGTGIGAFILHLLQGKGLLALPKVNIFGDVPVAGVLAGSVLMVLVGAIDDRHDLRPHQKFSGQIFAAFVAIALGVRIEGFTNPFDGSYVSLQAWQSWLLSFFWILGLTNAINFIDGLDGLAAGISAIAAGTLCVVSIEKGFGVVPPLVSMALAAMCGANLGFLPHNFNPARIFMGDCGAQLLGFLFASLAIVGTLKSAVAAGALMMTVVVLGYPVMDTAFAILRRLASGKAVYHADQGHLHHRLLAIGLSQRQAVLVLYLLSLVLCAAALLLARLA